jgi:Protein of unknown function (DUF1501)
LQEISAPCSVSDQKNSALVCNSLALIFAAIGTWLEVDVMNRRAFLQAGLFPPIGLGLADVLRLRSAAQASPGRSGAAKACILLYMTGGPAQHETFDPKPNAPDGIRGEFRPISTSVPGMQICELLPMLAQQAQRYSILRSVFHGSDTHGVGVHYNLTGLLHAPRRSGEPQLDRIDPPCMGSVVRQLRGDRHGLPAAVQLPRPVGDQNNAMWGGQHAGYLGPRYARNAKSRKAVMPAPSSARNHVLIFFAGV